MSHEYEYENLDGERLFTVNDLVPEKMKEFCKENGWIYIREVK